MTNSIAEIEKTDVILLTGTNTTENHPVISTYMKRAVTRGTAKLIVIDPRKIEMARFADIYLQPKPGTDVAWLNGLMNVIINEGLYDKEYVLTRTENFEAFKEIVQKYTPEYVEEISGIPRDDLIRAARMYAEVKRGSIYYAMGITQHTNGTDNVKSIANLAMLCGNIGIEGGGVNPLRGQNNVQGACDMGCLPNVYPGYQSVTDESFRSKFSQAWGSEIISGKAGLTVMEMFNEIENGNVKALYIMGENPFISDPDQHHVEEVLKKIELLVIQDIFMTETAKFAHVVLPSASFAEKEGTFTNTERRIQRVRKAVDAPGESREDWSPFVEISKKMGYTMNYESSEEIFEEIRGVTPSYAGVSYARMENGESPQWPCPDESHPGTKFLHKDKFSRGFGLFSAIDHTPSAELPDDEYPFILSTGRVLEHFHTGSMTRRSEGLNELYPEGVVEIHPEDALKYHISDRETIKVKSRRGSINISVKITSRSRKGIVFIPFHFAEAAANKLTNTAIDPVAKIPEFKVCAVNLEKV